MLHGAGGSTSNVIGQTEFAHLAMHEDFVVVFPNGTPSDESRPENFRSNPQTWNSGQGTSLAAGDRSAEAKNVQDVNFITGLIEYVKTRAKIDPLRIYIAGHSNGAGMAYRFACERPDIVASIGVVAGHLKEGLTKLNNPVSLIQICGDRDPLSPINGGLAGFGFKKIKTRPMQLYS